MTFYLVSKYEDAVTYNPQENNFPLGKGGYVRIQTENSTDFQIRNYSQDYPVTGSGEPSSAILANGEWYYVVEDYKVLGHGNGNVPTCKFEATGPKTVRKKT